MDRILSRSKARFWVRLLFTTAIAVSVVPAARAQAIPAAIPRITAPVDQTRLVTLAGNTHFLAQPKFDRGLAPDDASGRMLLILKRSPEQESALQQFLEAQQTPGSGQFHKWISPTEFGKRFGVADADVQTVTGYLASEGFQVGRIYRNNSAIEVTGTAGQIRKTFHTQMHTYQVGSHQFFANQGDPRIPEALSPVVAGFAAMNNFHDTAPLPSTQAIFDRNSGNLQPLYDGPANGSNPSYGISPGDLAKIYDIPAPSGTTAAAIGIVSDSNVNLNFIASYTSLFQTGAAAPTVVVDGNDPGISSNSLRTLEQLELISAVDPSAAITLYTSATTDFDTGIDFAIIRAVDDDVVNVLNIGVSTCEASLGATGNAFLTAAWEQAAAEGISVIAATGDSGSGGMRCSGRKLRHGSLGRRSRRQRLCLDSVRHGDRRH